MNQAKKEILIESIKKVLKEHDNGVDNSQNLEKRARSIAEDIGPQFYEDYVRVSGMKAINHFDEQIKEQLEASIKYIKKENEIKKIESYLEEVNDFINRSRKRASTYNENLNNVSEKTYAYYAEQNDLFGKLAKTSNQLTESRDERYTKVSAKLKESMEMLESMKLTTEKESLSTEGVFGFSDERPVKEELYEEPTFTIPSNLEEPTEGLPTEGIFKSDAEDEISKLKEVKEEYLNKSIKEAQNGKILL